MTELNNFPTPISKSEEPFRLPDITRSKLTVECPKCKSNAEPFSVPGHDSSNSQSYRCTNTNCLHIDLYYRFVRKYNEGPLGSVNPDDLLKPRHFQVIRTRRTTPSKRPRSTANNRTYNTNQQFTPTEDPIPKLAGKPDTDLEAMLKDRPGIITALVDSDTTEQELE